MKIILLALLFSMTAAANDLRVGVSKVDITPKLCTGKSEHPLLPPYDSFKGCFRWIHLGGFSPYYTVFDKNKRLAEGVHDQIWSRALALEGSNGEKLLMISTDLPGVTWKHANPVRRRLAKNFGIPVENIIVHSTHAHSAPDAAGYWSTLLWMHNRDYTNKLREWIYESGRAALLNMAPAKMKLVTTSHFACFDPKTFELKKAPDCNLAQFDYQNKIPGNNYDEILIQADHRDPMIGNTRIVAAQFVHKYKNNTIATFVNWHNHPDTLGSSNRLVSSDYPHYLREYVEKFLGGTAVYFVGTLGSQIGGLRNTKVPMWNDQFQRVYQPGVIDPKGRPVPVLVREEGYEQIRGTGYEVASEAVQALEKASFVESVDIKVKTEAVDNQVDNFIHNLMTGSVWTFDVAFKDRMRRYLTQCFGLLGCVRSDVSIIQIGELGIATAPGEIDPAYFYGRKAMKADYGEKWGEWTFPAMPGLEKYIPGTHKTMIGSAQNYLSYLVPESDNVGPLNTDHPNHYEELVTIGKHFGDDTGNKLMEMLGSKERYNNRPILPRKRTN